MLDTHVPKKGNKFVLHTKTHTSNYIKYIIPKIWPILLLCLHLNYDYIFG